ncbi:L,D-transpeptidase [Asticcacaulis machinosus]|uniref:L,D-transpeptidase n=1 Tax=Asticcacaulis machinosus TaxID=2984211 RepID=A0ABT5HMN2_9CAUL|nr:L,D-transpeptidase [Asticcacaulis machinosus]MDC7677508.1 L,D-transpeptidase [Asticcacaulis machinosus]
MRIIFYLIAFFALSGSAIAQGAKVSSPVELARQADKLKPGQWVWAPEIAPKGPLLVYVDLSKQLATIYRNGVRIGVSTVSTGKPGHETPTGVFTILQKDADHRSNIYNNAPMPFQQRLTWGGVALHAGGLPGYPESHGCVHLPYNFARELFRTTELGATVVVAGNAAHPVSTGLGEVLAPAVAETDALAPAGTYWAPERAPWGPVTIILSRTDQQAVVLRNGVEIGRSAIQIPNQNESTHVLTLTKTADGQTEWIYAGIAGHTAEAGASLDEAVRNHVNIPKDFYSKVSAILQPGTTLLVTQSPLNSGSTGEKLTILSGEKAPS